MRYHPKLNNTKIVAHPKLKSGNNLAPSKTLFPKMWYHPRKGRELVECNLDCAAFAATWFGWCHISGCIEFRWATVLVLVSFGWWHISGTDLNDKNYICQISSPLNFSFTLLVQKVCQYSWQKIMKIARVSRTGMTEPLRDENANCSRIIPVISFSSILIHILVFAGKKCRTSTYLLSTDPTDLSKGGESAIAR